MFGGFIVCNFIINSIAPGTYKMPETFFAIISLVTLNSKSVVFLQTLPPIHRFQFAAAPFRLSVFKFNAISVSTLMGCRIKMLHTNHFKFILQSLHGTAYSMLSCFLPGCLLSLPPFVCLVVNVRFLNLCASSTNKWSTIALKINTDILFSSTLYFPEGMPKLFFLISNLTAIQVIFLHQYL